MRHAWSRALDARHAPPPRRHARAPEPQRRAQSRPGRRTPGDVTSARVFLPELVRLRDAGVGQVYGLRALALADEALASRTSRVSNGAYPSRGFIRHRTPASTIAKSTVRASIGTTTSPSPAPRSMIRRDAIWYQRSGNT